MWNKVKTAALIGLEIKNALNALLKPGVFIKDKIYSLIIEIVLYFIKKAISENLAQKIQGTATKSLEMSFNIPMHSTVKEALKNDNFQELHELAKEAINVPLEAAGLQCNSLLVSLNEKEIVTFDISFGLKESLQQKLTFKQEK